MSESAPKVQKLSLSIDYRWISLGLVAVVIVMLFLWKPWQVSKVTDRTVNVTGTSTVSARPDEFVFYPTYEFKTRDKNAAIAELSAKSNTVVAELKKLGVPDKDIKVNSDSWSYPEYRAEDSGSISIYTLRLTVTVDNETVAQKVQDYLLTTSPTGTISPQPTFSEKKRKEVEDKGRFEASKDARTKAEQSAKNLGFKLSAVKSVNDGSGFSGYPIPMYDGKSAMATDSAAPSLILQPGQNDLTYTVTVVYYIR